MGSNGVPELLMSIISCCFLFSDLRLTTVGEGNDETLVEIYHRNRWRTFCNKGFDDIDALVICRQLGYR